MKKKIVRFKGKRHNLYFNDEGPQHLIPLDKDGKEVPNVKIEEFEESDIEELKMFDEEYVGQLRDENKKTREALESLQKQFEGLDPEQLQEMAKKLKDAEDAKEKERQEALKKEGKWQELMDQQKADFEKQLDAEKTRADTAVRDLESYRVSTVLRDHVSVVENIVPGAVSQVVDLLKRFVVVQKEGTFKILDDDMTSTRLKPDSADPATITDLVSVFMEKNPWFIKGSGAGAGSGGDGGAGEGEVNPWKKDTWNLTQQGQITKNDPNKAKRMKVAAGMRDAA